MFAMRVLALIVMLPALVAGSITMAVARSQPQAVGHVWLCTGTGVIALSVDAQGNPTGPEWPCPECTLTLAALDTGPVRAPGAAVRLAPVQPPHVRAFAQRTAPAPVPPARGPPVPV